jgi:hypothetical protein
MISVAEVSESRSRRRIEPHSRRTAAQSVVTGHADPSPPADRAPAPQPAIVFRAASGGMVCHVRCGQPLEFQGRRAGVELDFYCHRCIEHVTVPECLVPLIPVAGDRLAGATAAA